MSQQELLARVIRVLNDAAVPYMVTGSVVSSTQGEPRSTHDIDIVVAISASSARLLAQNFPPPDYYLDADAILDAIRNQSMFNLIDARDGGKVDFWILTKDPFRQACFNRRHAEEAAGLCLMVSRPEDTILSKLRWAKESGGSEKQLTDALRVFEVQFMQLDTDYLERWAKRLEVVELLERIKHEAQPPF